MNPACSTCRHWKLEGTQDWEAERAGFGECLAVRERWAITGEVGGYRVSLEYDYEDMTPAERIESKMEERTAALRAARAYVQDGSEYRAELFTGPDFFCALYDTNEGS